MSNSTRNTMGDIIIEVTGGVVQKVAIPEGCGYRVVVRDYDNGFMDEDEIVSEFSEDIYLATPRNG